MSVHGNMQRIEGYIRNILFKNICYKTHIYTDQTEGTALILCCMEEGSY